MSLGSDDPRKVLRRQFEILASAPAALEQLVSAFHGLLALQQQEVALTAQAALYDDSLRPRACQLDGMREQLVELIRMMESCKKSA